MTVPTLAHETIVERRGDDALNRMTHHVLDHRKVAPDGSDAPDAPDPVYDMLPGADEQPAPEPAPPASKPAERDPYVG